MLGRRKFLKATTGAAVLAMAGPTSRATSVAKRPRVATLVTEFTYRSHAHVILENFLERYYFNGELIDGGVDVASLYVDQFPAGRDMARDVAKRYGIPIYPTIAEALQLGGKSLTVDGVLSIAEHGDYPVNERFQVMYPRKRFFDETVAVFRRSRRVVPFFNDKHLSYRWDWSAEMMRTVREMKIPFMAGGSVPLAERRPAMEVPADARIEEAVSIHGGPLEQYDYHGIEVVQSIVESRRGGETGVKRVQFLQGEAVWDAFAQGRRSLGLAEAALAAETGDASAGSLRTFVERSGDPPHAILIDYTDGLRGTILRVGTDHTRWNFACRIAGRAEPLATRFHVGPWRNRCLFKALAHAVQSFVIRGRSPYPVERTYLTTGVLCAAMDSHFERDRAVETPHLADLAYQPTDWRGMRETGRTWQIITDETPQPLGIDAGGVLSRR